MKVLFLSANLGGNVPPTVAIALELCRRGAQVDVAGILVGAGPTADSGDGPPDDAAALTEVDASWGQKRDASGSPEPVGPALLRIFVSRGLAAEAEALIRDHRPDVVVVDCMALALIQGANRSGVPVVVLFHTFAEYWRRAFLAGPFGALVGALGFSPRALWGAATLRLVLTDPVLDPASHKPEFADYVWTGTTEVGPTESPLGSTTPPRVVVSFSTTSLPGMRRAYRNAIEALQELPVVAIVTTGGFEIGDSPPAAFNVEVRGFVPHAELLPGAALVIGHGGHSTTMKALSYGVPLLVMPLNPTADQGLIGDVLERAGMGRRISARSDPTKIRREAAGLLQDVTVRERAQTTAARLRSAKPGAEVAATRILEAARS
ncbi:glycosyltransferase [Micromonospora sp. DT81.3]|uniref:glycosyltransferase n=1 Tax=Micromonospora sp. DT81.3 TaxID=3416523 RepID=UPI003CE86F15